MLDVAPEGRLVNVLGALSIAACDLISTASGEIEVHSENDAAALNFIGHAPGISIDVLAHTLHLSHPGTVRLVDRLCNDGLVERREGKDRRTLALFLTGTGKRRRVRLQQGRLGSLHELLRPLSANERQELERIIVKMLEGHVQEMYQAATVCRFCDERVCVPCPMERLSD